MISNELIHLFKPLTPHHHIYCTDKNHINLSCNEQQAIDVGLSEFEFIGKNIIDIYSTEECAVYIQNNETVLKTGKPLTCFEKVKTRSGLEIIYKTHKSPLKNEKNKVVAVFGMSVIFKKLSVNDAIYHDEKKFYLGGLFNNTYLTRKETAVFKSLLLGESVEEISIKLSRSTKTIQTQIKSIANKMGCSHKSKIVPTAIKYGLTHILCEI